MFPRSKRPSLSTLQLFTLTSLVVGVCLFPLPAWAQADEERPRTAAGETPDDEAEEEEEEPATGEARKTPGATGVTAQTACCLIRTASSIQPGRLFFM